MGPYLLFVSCGRNVAVSFLLKWAKHCGIPQKACNQYHGLISCWVTCNTGDIWPIWWVTAFLAAAVMTRHTMKRSARSQTSVLLGAHQKDYKLAEAEMVKNKLSKCCLRAKREKKTTTIKINTVDYSQWHGFLYIFPIPKANRWNAKFNNMTWNAVWQ